MDISFRAINLKDVLYVCENMRASDWKEVLNALPRAVTTPEVIAMICMNATNFGIIACVDNRPAIVAQFSEILDGTWRAGLFGTEEFEFAAMPMIAELMREAFPFMIDRGAVYCEAYADALNSDGHKLLEFVGFKKRAILEGYGSRGMDVALYSITKSEVDNVLLNGRWRIIKRKHTDDRNNRDG